MEAGLSMARRTGAKAVDTPLARSAGDKTSTPVAYADGPAYGESLRQDVRNVGDLLNTLGVKAQ